MYIGSSMYDVTNDLVNWDDIYSKLKRINYGGVMRSFAGKFEFVRNAREVIRKDLMDNMMYSVPRLVWYERGENWAWKEVFSYILDISSFDDDGSTISINAVDDSLMSLIKAKKGTQYEYLVDTIKEDKSLYYDRLSIYNSGNYYPYSKNYDSSNPKEPIDDEVVINYSNSVSGNHYYVFPLSPSDNSEIYNASVAEILDNSNPDNHGAILRFTGTNAVNISMKFNITRSDESDYLIRFVIIQGPLQTVIREFRNDSGTVEYSVNIPKYYLSNGTMLKVDFSVGIGYNQWIAISKFEYFTIRYSSIDKPSNINVVTPVKLLNRLLQSINNGKDGLIGEIEDGDDRLDNCLVLAAESVRGLPGAKLYSSFTKFENWMSAEFGFIYEIDGNIVRFVHRDSLYEREVVKVLGGDVSEFSCRVEPSLIYAQVNVGYDKQEYDSVNGRDEFRFTTEYSTNITLTDNKLELISPYRSDAYGVEFLVQKRGENTTDKDSDNDVFFVGAKLNSSGSRYELVRGGNYQISGVISPETMFNAMYSPRQMLMANKAFIGVSVDILEYASSSGNSEVVIDSVGEKDSVIIGKSEALFMPMSVEIQTCEQSLPDNKNGLISIRSGGAVYRGFIDEIERFHGKSKSNSYKLMLLDVVAST